MDDAQLEEKMRDKAVQANKDFAVSRGSTRKTPMRRIPLSFS